jgi:hypothetical protein
MTCPKIVHSGPVSILSQVVTLSETTSQLPVDWSVISTIMLTRARLRFAASTFPTSTACRSTRLVPGFATANRINATYLRPLATTASGDGNGGLQKRLRRKPSAIAQRLPDPDVVHAPHRFREFEVRLKFTWTQPGFGMLMLSSYSSMAVYSW